MNYKYNEDKAIAAIQEYLDGTYGQHYVGDGDVQTVDFWRSLGSLESTSRDTAIKYLARYGKKGGKNRKDLFKAVHYIILMMYALDLEEDQDDEFTINLEGLDTIDLTDVGDYVDYDMGVADLDTLTVTLSVGDEDDKT